MIKFASNNIQYGKLAFASYRRHRSSQHRLGDGLAIDNSFTFSRPGWW